MEYLDGWLVGSDNILISSIFVPHAATSNIRSSPPIHALTISTFTFYLSTVQRKYTQKCLLACSLFRAHDQCLMSFSFAWTIYLLTLIIWIVRSFVRSSHFFFLYLNRCPHFGARSNENDTLKLKRKHTANTRCIPRIRWSNECKCFMFNAVFIWFLFFIYFPGCFCRAFLSSRMCRKVMPVHVGSLSSMFICSFNFMLFLTYLAT